MSTAFRPILAAEDEENDRFILNLAFDQAKLSHPLVTVRDGQECEPFLKSFLCRAAQANPLLPGKFDAIGFSPDLFAHSDQRRPEF